MDAIKRIEYLLMAVVVVVGLIAGIHSLVPA